MLKLKWNKNLVRYETELTLNEVINEFKGYIGCVYPIDGESYFIDSGGSMLLSEVRCLDGYFFADDKECMRIMYWKKRGLN